MNWKSARAFCSAHGMELASFHTKMEFEDVVRNNPKRGQSACEFAILYYPVVDYYFFAKQKLKSLSKLSSHSGSYWVGASDIGQNPGHFLWADGTEVDNTFWYTGTFPSRYGSGKETCVDLWAGNGKLHDVPCNDLRSSMICELPPKDQLCL